jgi:hypothetical protein
MCEDIWDLLLLQETMKDLRRIGAVGPAALEKPGAVQIAVKAGCSDDSRATKGSEAKRKDSVAQGAKETSSWGFWTC